MGRGSVATTVRVVPLNAAFLKELQSTIVAPKTWVEVLLLKAEG